MNKYPAPAPQQYSDYEDDDGPGLGTLGAALAAGALLTPVGRPVRALAKKGLGAADEVLGGYGKAGVGKLQEGGAAARKAILGENDIFSEIGQNYKTAELRNLQADRAGYKFYNPQEDFTTDATLHNLGMMAQGPKSVFETLFRNKNLNPQLNPNPLVDARAAADATIGAAGERLTKTAKAREAADATIASAAAKMQGTGFVPPTVADRVAEVRADSLAKIANRNPGTIFKEENLPQTRRMKTIDKSYEQWTKSGMSEDLKRQAVIEWSKDPKQSPDAVVAKLLAAQTAAE